MAWTQDHLAPVETLLFRSDVVKVGCFECTASHPSFARTASLDNDVFVVLRRPLWIRRNSGSYRFVEPGGILMHRAGSTLERRCAEDAGERTYWFGMHPEVFVETLRRYGLSTDEMGGALIAEPRFRYRLALFIKRFMSGTMSTLAVEEEVLSLFIEICERRADRLRAASKTRLDTTARQRRLVDKARAYLDAHLTETIGLEVVAHAAGTSMYHLCRVFREQTGITMHAYRTGQRLGQALDRLVDDATPNLSELALELGFCSHSHLSRVFQKQMGMPPSSLRAH